MPLTLAETLSKTARIGLKVVENNLKAIEKLSMAGFSQCKCVESICSESLYTQYIMQFERGKLYDEPDSSRITKKSE